MQYASASSNQRAYPVAYQPGSFEQGKGRGSALMMRNSSGRHGCVGNAGRATLQLVREATGVHGSRSKTQAEDAPEATGVNGSKDRTLGCGGGKGGVLCSPLSHFVTSWNRRTSADDFGLETADRWGVHDYDEELQEHVYLGEVFYNVKNTFIHCDVDEHVAEKDWQSSPSRMLNKSFHTIYPKMEAAHYAGTCRPCAYFLYKGDGCRWGADCQFCHLCKRGEIKRRKKEKARNLRKAKQEFMEAAFEADPSVPGISTPSSAGDFDD